MLRRASRCRDARCRICPSSLLLASQAPSDTTASLINHASARLSRKHYRTPVGPNGQDQNIRLIQNEEIWALLSANERYQASLSQSRFLKEARIARQELGVAFEGKTDVESSSKNDRELTAAFDRVSQALNSERNFQRSLVSRSLELVPKTYHPGILPRWKSLKRVMDEIQKKIESYRDRFERLYGQKRASERELMVAVLTGSRFRLRRDEEYAVKEAERRQEGIQRSIIFQYHRLNQDREMFLSDMAPIVFQRRGHVNDLLEELKLIAHLTEAESPKMKKLVGDFDSHNFDLVEKELSSMAAPTDPLDDETYSFAEQKFARTRSEKLRASVTADETDVEQMEPAGYNQETPYHICFTISPRDFQGCMVFSEETLIRPAYSTYRKTVRKRSKDIEEVSDDFSVSQAELLTRDRPFPPALSALYRIEDFLRPPAWPHATGSLKEHDDIYKILSTFTGYKYSWATDIYPANITIEAGGIHNEIIRRPNTFAVYTDGAAIGRKAPSGAGDKAWIDVCAGAVLPSHSTIIASAIITPDEPQNCVSDIAELFATVQGLEVAADLASTNQHVAIFTDNVRYKDPYDEIKKKPAHQDPLYLQLYHKILVSLELLDQKNATAALYWLPKRYTLIPNRAAHTAAGFMGKTALPAEYLRKDFWRDGLIWQTFRSARNDAYLSDVG